MTMLIRLVPILALLASLSARAADPPYDINVILSLSGSAAFLAASEQQAIQVAEKVINRDGGIKGRPVRFVFFDDQSSPQVTVQLINQIMNQTPKPPVVIGSSLIAECNAMLPIVEAARGPVVYCVSPSFAPPPGSYGFSGTVHTRDLQRALLAYFRLKGMKRVALITSTDSTGQDAEQGIVAAAKLPENKEIALVEQAHFTPTDVSVTAQIEHIRSAKPQAIVGWSTGTPIATVLRAVKQVGIDDIPFATTNGNQIFAQMAQYQSFLPRSFYIPSGAWPELPAGFPIDPKVAEEHKNFFDGFKEAGVRPDGASSLPWDLTMIVIEGLRKLGTNATAQQLRDHIAHVKGHAGLMGIYDFEKTPQRGLDFSNAVVTLWNGEAKSFDLVSRPGGAPLAN